VNQVCRQSIGKPYVSAANSAVEDGMISFSPGGGLEQLS